MGLKTRDIAFNLQLDGDNFLAVWSENEDIGLPHGLAKKIEPAGCPGDRIGQGGIGDQNVMRVGGQIDHERLVQAELHPLADARTGALDLDDALSGCRRRHD